MTLFRLPVCGASVRLRAPTGAEDLLLLEAPARDTGLALAVAGRLAEASDGTPLAWERLSLTDLDALLLRLRQSVLGDLVRADARCPAPECGSRFDISFRISEFLAHHAPRRPRTVEAVREAPEGAEDEEGWYRLVNASVSFRLPTAADQVRAGGEPHPERALVRRCVRPDGLPRRMLTRVERAMEALAPPLSRELEAVCFECGVTVRLFFDVAEYTLTELRDQSSGLYEEIHLLAHRYHWSESQILALPRARRARYAELARQEGTAA